MQYTPGLSNSQIIPHASQPTEQMSALSRFEFCVSAAREAWGNTFSCGPETLINYLTVKSCMRATF
jgi:hypothetical protein